MIIHFLTNTFSNRILIILEIRCEPCLRGRLIERDCKLLEETIFDEGEKYKLIGMRFMDGLDLVHGILCRTRTM